MNEQPKSKVLIMIIGILLIANIAMLAFFMLETHTEEKKERAGKNNYISEYLEKEVGFNAEQLARYDSLSKRHREQLKSTFNELLAERKKICTALVEASFSDSAINNAANDIHEQQKIIGLNMLRHLKEIRGICTAAQLPRFDTGFYKIFGKRSETHKEK